MRELTVNGLDEMDVQVQNTPVSELESEQVNLIFLGIDGSGSMSGFSTIMIQEMDKFKTALINGKDVDDFLVSKAVFRESDVDIAGYKKVEELDTSYYASGTTPLYETIVKGTEELLKYMEVLKKNGTRVKAVFSIFSDGNDNASRNNKFDAVKAIEKLNQKEVITSFISFGPDARNIGTGLGFRNILDANATESELRKAFGSLSKSIIENSKSVTQKTDNFYI